MDFILEIEDNISKELCDRIIKKFNENSSVHKKGKIGIEPDKKCKDNGTVFSKWKDTREMFISNLPDWQDIDEELSKSLKRGIHQYTETLSAFLKPIYNDDENLLLNLNAIHLFSLQDKGYNVQRVIKNDSWHQDSNLMERKVLVGIWYFNTIAPENGGATEFINGRKVQPVAGKLVLYPASWHHMHKGSLFKNTEKYICTVSLYPDV